MTITKSTATVSTTYKMKRAIEYIAIHYTAGTTSKAGTALNLAKWFANGGNPANPASSDFIVDDKYIVQYNGDILNRYTWGVGGGKYTPTTSLSAILYGKATNSNVINIEVCSSKTNSRSLNANDTDWYFTDAALNNTVELVQYLMKEYNIDINHVITHHMVTGKPCPAMWSHNEKELQGWYDFKNRVSGKTATTTTQTTPTTGKIYRVQVGAFRNKANADAQLKQVQKYFPTAFIKTDDK